LSQPFELPEPSGTGNSGFAISATLDDDHDPRQVITAPDSHPTLFLLDLQNDTHARVALAAYAASVSDEDKELYERIRYFLNTFNRLEL
jgi:hypothetical protein